MAAPANPAQLFLLADHVKLSLLERQRAGGGGAGQDAQIARSLESLAAGVQALEARGDEDAATRDTASRLRAQHAELAAQFALPAGPPTTSPAPPSSSGAPAPRKPARKSPSISPPAPGRRSSKSVRFTDTPSSPPPPGSPTERAARAALFPYRDDPDTGDDAAAATPDQRSWSNQQIHAHHSTALREQDAQLDVLGASIGRQRELSMQIGDELEGQALLLDDVGDGADRHLGQVGRARKRLEVVGRRARENWSVGVIVGLIVVLVLLIVILK